MTVRTPAERLVEANTSDTWRPPTEYSLEFAVPVVDALNTERVVHAQLEEYGYRINPRREFFNAPIAIVKKIFEAVREEDAFSPVLVITEKESPVSKTRTERDLLACKHLCLRSGRTIVR